MKKRLIIIGLAMVLFLTGCMKSETNMTIKADKSMDFRATYLFSKALLNLGEGSEDFSVNEEQKANAAKRGYQVENYSDDEYSGIIITKKYKNIDDLSSNKAIEIELSKFLDENFKDDKIFQVKEGFLKNTYTAAFTYDLQSEDTEEETIDMSAYTNSIIINYSVTLPSKAISNDATSVSEDKLTYTWKAKYGELNKINYSFEIVNQNNLILIAIGGLSLLALIDLIVIISKLKKNRQK